MNAATLSSIWQQVSRGNKIAITVLGKLREMGIFMLAEHYNGNTMNVGTNVTKQVTINEVDTSKAFILVGTIGSSVNAERKDFRYRFLNSTTAYFECTVISSTTLNFNFTVISW